MREQIGKEVGVVMYFSAKKRVAKPHLISWQNKEYTVKEIGYQHKVLDGKILHHIFELTVNEIDLWMRLNLDTSNLHWTLEVVSDGLTT
jgi:hypothetical protein